MSAAKYTVTPAVLALFCAAIVVAARPANAAPLLVTTTADSGSGSLRQALADAQDGDTIQFDPSLNGQTILLTSGELAVNNSITISGPGDNLLAVSRPFEGPDYRIFHVTSGHTVNMEGLTISNGKSDHSGGTGILVQDANLTINSCTISGNAIASLGGGSIAIISNTSIINTLNIVRSRIINNRGGGINNHRSILTITDSTISGNFNDYGGAIYGGGSVISNCTISGNTASSGGGIYADGPLTIRNSTLSGNSTFIQGGQGGAIWLVPPGGTITNCTFSGNTATNGGGIYLSGALTMGNTIMQAGSSGANISGGPIASLGYNLSSDNSAGFTGPGDQINTNPMLGGLQDNGGPTFTQALLPGSPAIDTGDPNFTPPPSTDQRGYPRVSNGRIDKGSFEVQVPVTPSPTPMPTPTPCLPVVTQSSSQAITTGNSLSCNDGTTHTDNSYWRAFDMTAYAGGGQYCINSVSFGVEFANITQPVTVHLYTTSNFPAGFPGSLSQIAATTLNVGSAQNGTVVTTPLVVTVPAGTPQLVMELFTPNGQPGGYRFFVGSNAALETGPSYFSAPACGITTPTTTAAIGFPNMHIVFDVNGTCTCPTPTPTPCPIYNISGKVGQCTTAGPSGIALPGVTITRTVSGGGGNGSTTTDQNGNYFFPAFGCETNTFTPSKAARLPGSPGINTIDVLAVQRHFLAISLLTGCQLGAADCASPAGITTVDVIAIQRFFLGMTTGTGNVGKYGFTPASRSYSLLFSDQTNQNYDAIVFGDVASPFALP